MNFVAEMQTKKSKKKSTHWKSTAIGPIISRQILCSHRFADFHLNRNSVILFDGHNIQTIVVRLDILAVRLRTDNVVRKRCHHIPHQQFQTKSKIPSNSIRIGALHPRFDICGAIREIGWLCYVDNEKEDAKIV